MGIVLLMDMLTRRVVKALSYFPDLYIDDYIFHGFEDFEEFDLSFLLKSIKANKSSERIASKTKAGGIKFKDYSAIIESLSFSDDGGKLLVGYKIKSCPKIEDEEDSHLYSIGNKLCEWSVIEGKITNFFEHDSKISEAHYLPNHSDTVIFGGTYPYILRKWTDLDCLVDIQEVR